MEIPDEHIYIHESECYNRILEKSALTGLQISVLRDKGVRIYYVDYRPTPYRVIKAEAIRRVANLPNEGAPPNSGKLNLTVYGRRVAVNAEVFSRHSGGEARGSREPEPQSCMR